MSWLALVIAMGPSVSIEVGAPSGHLAHVAPTKAEAEASAAGLRDWVVARLREEGVVVAEGGAPADEVIRIHDGPDSVVVEVGGERHEIEHGPVALMRLEILHRARLALEDDPAPKEPAEAPRLSATVATPVVAAEPSAPPPQVVAAAPIDRRYTRRNGKPRRWTRDDGEVRIGAEVGAAVRGGVDAAVRGFTRFGLAPGPGATLQVALIPSRSRSVRAVDTILAAGPDFHLGRGRFGFDAGIVGGARIHAFQVDVDSGGNVDWYAGLPVSVSLGKPRGPRVHLFTETSVTGSGQEHRVAGGPTWRRTAWGFRVGLGFSFGWSIL